MQVADTKSEVGDSWFDRHWALAVMGRGLDQVKRSFEQAAKIEQFEALKPWLMGDPEGITQSDAAEQLGMTRAAVKMAVHRLRQKFGEAIRREIADTVDTETAVSEELQYLIEVLQTCQVAPNESD